jgi:hypothetical protein
MLPPPQSFCVLLVPCCQVCSGACFPRLAAGALRRCLPHQQSLHLHRSVLLLVLEDATPAAVLAPASCTSPRSRGPRNLERDLWVASTADGVAIDLCSASAAAREHVMSCRTPGRPRVGRTCACNGLCASAGAGAKICGSWDEAGRIRATGCLCRRKTRHVCRVRGARRRRGAAQPEGSAACAVENSGFSLRRVDRSESRARIGGQGRRH